MLSIVKEPQFFSLSLLFWASCLLVPFSHSSSFCLIKIKRRGWKITFSILISYLFLFIESEDKYTSPSEDGNDMGQATKKKKKIDSDLRGLIHRNM